MRSSARYAILRGDGRNLFGLKYCFLSDTQAYCDSTSREAPVRRIAASLLIALSVPLSTVEAADTGVPEIPPPDAQPSPDPMDPNAKPVSARAERALWNAAVEGGDDITTQLVTHVVQIRVTADEEWRAFFGSSWTGAANNRLEEADNAFFSAFGIDFSAAAYVDWWDSADGTRAICTIFNEMSAEITHGGWDVVYGFTKNPYSGGAGCASGNNNKGLTGYQSYDSDWKVTQHEFGHIYNVPDRYGQPDSAQHPDDVMEKIYTHYNIWCVTAPWDDDGRIYNNRFKFG